MKTKNNYNKTLIPNKNFELHYIINPFQYKSSDNFSKYFVGKWNLIYMVNILCNMTYFYRKENGMQ